MLMRKDSCSDFESEQGWWEPVKIGKKKSPRSDLLKSNE
jgi:hypothetical protein